MRGSEPDSPRGFFDAFNSIQPIQKRFHSCCGCCHVKQGAFILGLFELLVTIILLAFVINRLHESKSSSPYPTQACLEAPRPGNIKPDQRSYEASPIGCNPAINASKVREKTSLSHFSQQATTVGDFVATALLILSLVVVICLFYGLFNKRPKYLVPHLVLQALILLFSLVFLILYAWDYFYVRLYLRNEPFGWSSFGEHIWLLVFYVLVGVLEIYVFSTLIACYRYLKERRRREKFHELPAAV